MLNKRIWSAIAGIIILILFLYSGSVPFYLFISGLIIIAMYEYNRMIPEKIRINSFIIIIFALSITAYNYFLNLPREFIYLIIIIVLILYFLYKQGYNNISYSMGIYIMGLLYISGGFSYFIFLRDYPGEFLFKQGALWLVLISTWAADTGAYFSGKYLGRKKLAAKISPNKTVIGAVGGTLLTILVVTLITFLNGIFSYEWVIYGMLISFLSIIGDLFESSLKRNAGVKDSGKIMPGHGGILDRFDSLLLTVPFTYYFLLLFI